jgi:hypothetical protein
MKRIMHFFPLFVACTPLWVVPLTLDAEITAPQLLPESTIFYAEIADPTGLTETLLEHPLVEKLLELDSYQQVFNSPEYEQFQQVLKSVEAQLGKTWDEALVDLASRGIYVAFDPASQGGAVLARARDADSLVRLRDLLLNLAAAEAARQEQEDPVRRAEYRGVSVFQIDDNIKFATFDDWLMVVTESKLGAAILDRYVDSKSATHKSLATTASFQEALGSRGDEQTAWAYVGIEPIRQLGGLVQLTQAARENMLVELLAGGVIAAIQEAGYVTASLELNDETLELSMMLPCDDSSLSESRSYFFGPGGKGAAPAIGEVEDTILSFSIYRDVSQMWLRAPDLFSDEVNDGLAEADSNLSVFFAGKDFGEDILGALEPELQLIVTRQQFDPERPVPQIKLPAFALVAKMRKPEEMTGELRRVFHSMIGFINVVGAMEGQPQMDFEFDKRGEAQLIAAHFLPDANQQPSQVKIHYNFSPTVVFRNEMVIISSTQSLGEELLGASKKLAKGDGENMALYLNFPAAQKALADNREQLIVQNILSDGTTQEEAAGQIDLILKLLGEVKSLELDLARKDGQIRFRASLSY